MQDLQIAIFKEITKMNAERWPETVLDALWRHPVVHHRLHDPEDAQADAGELHQGEGEEAFLCDHKANILPDHRLVHEWNVSSVPPRSFCCA